jgi:beta-mannosidase
MAAVPFTRLPLTTNWTFKQGDRDSPSEYLPANDLPTEVHRDLLKNDKIPDPFKNLNELSVRWVADEKWTYRTTFPTPDRFQDQGVTVVLVLQGLDTFTSIYLNEQHLLSTDNAFIEHRVNVRTFLHSEPDEENVLEIVFDSARQRGLQLVKEHPEHNYIVHQTEVSRGPVRKPQYHWGWDWGPILLTCGPWKPIYLETSISKIEDVWMEYELTEDLTEAKGNIFLRTQGPGGRVEIEIQEKQGNLAKTKVSCLDHCNYNSTTKYAFTVQIEPWWPRGYGKQPLYTLTARLFDEEDERKEVPSTPVHEISKTIGFRNVDLIQEEDGFGTSFHFRINNIDIFAGGACWIPADSFLSTMTPDRYREWIRLAVEGNQNMIRVWGGGVYEADAFYEACDEFGVLVWQDFMFACANYPAHKEYLKSVEEEARQNVRRLRNHPSIVLWCGNNEDYQIVERYNLTYEPENKDPESWLETDFPARYIYEHLLPKVVREEAKAVPYHPSSPFGNGKSTVLKVDPTVGDIHQWNTWHGEMKPYQQLPHMGGRFVSEFGMEAYPHVSTLEACITRRKDRYPGSMAMDFRNKAIGHERRLGSYVAENFKMMHDLEGFTHLTQVMQADAMRWAYKSWRRQWGTKGKRQCGGVLVWQLNDCWPTISWAVVDYYLVPKPAYYAIKRAMTSLTISVMRKFKDWTMRPADELWKRDTGHVDPRPLWDDVKYEVWVSSLEAEKRMTDSGELEVEPIKGTVTVSTFSIKTGQPLPLGRTHEVTILPNATTEVAHEEEFWKASYRTVKGNPPYDISKEDPFVIQATLTIGGKVVATDVSWPEPIKYLDFSDRGVKLHYSQDTLSVSVTTTKPVKGFVFSERKGVSLSDNGFDVMPGESIDVEVSGARADTLKWMYVGM